TVGKDLDASTSAEWTGSTVQLWDARRPRGAPRRRRRRGTVGSARRGDPAGRRTAGRRPRASRPLPTGWGARAPPPTTGGAGRSVARPTRVDRGGDPTSRGARRAARGSWRPVVATTRTSISRTSRHRCLPRVVDWFRWRREPGRQTARRPWPGQWRPDR